MTRLERLRKLLDESPDDVFLNFGLAMEMLKHDDVDAALVQFDRVLELDPNYTGAYFHKANTLIGQQRLDEARSVLEAGIDVAGRVGEDHAQGEMRELLVSIQ